MRRVLGRSGIEVSAPGIGTWVIGGPMTSGDQPLGWGEVDDVRHRQPQWLRWFTDGRTLAQGALAWVWARSPRAVSIPECRTVAQVEENVGAMTHGPLTPGQLAEVEAVLRPAAAAR